MRITVSAQALAVIERHKRKGEIDRDVVDRLLGITRLNLMKTTKPRALSGSAMLS